MENLKQILNNLIGGTGEDPVWLNKYETLLYDPLVENLQNLTPELIETILHLGEEELRLVHGPVRQTLKKKNTKELRDLYIKICKKLNLNLNDYLFGI